VSLYKPPSYKQINFVKNIKVPKYEVSSRKNKHSASNFLSHRSKSPSNKYLDFGISKELEESDIVKSNQNSSLEEIRSDDLFEYLSPQGIANNP